MGLFGILLVVWLGRITAFSPDPWLAAAGIGMIPGVAVVDAVALIYGGSLVVACRPRTWRARSELRAKNIPPGEEHPR